MKGKKTKTNEYLLRQLLKDITPIEAAMLRERIIKIAEITEQSIKEEPEAWKGSFIHPNAYLELNKKIQNSLGFDN